MRASRQPSTPAPPAVGDEPSVDPGILAFGTSVSVNDDLRRSILTEIEEIDESISTTASQIKTEEKSQEELRKSRGNSIKESRSILETVTENFGTLDMQRQMLKNLEHTFQAEIAPGSTVVSPDRETNGATNQDTAESNGAAENLPPTIGSLSVASLQKEHMTVETSLVAMKEAVVANIRDLQHLAVEKKTHLTAAAEIQNRIEAENLSGLLEELEEKMKYGEHVKQSEIKRQSTLMTNHDAAEERVQKAQKAKQAMVGSTRKEFAFPFNI